MHTSYVFTPLPFIPLTLMRSGRNVLRAMRGSAPGSISTIWSYSRLAPPSAQMRVVAAGTANSTTQHGTPHLRYCSLTNAHHCTDTPKPSALPMYASASRRSTQFQHSCYSGSSLCSALHSDNCHLHELQMHSMRLGHGVNRCQHITHCVSCQDLVINYLCARAVPSAVAGCSSALSGAGVCLVGAHPATETRWLLSASGACGRLALLLY